MTECDNFSELIFSKPAVQMKNLLKSVNPVKGVVMLSAVVFGVSSTSVAQVAKSEPEAYNRWSLELAGGLSNAVGPYAPGHYTNLLNLSNLQLGARYMANRHVGLKLDAEYNTFKAGDAKNSAASLPFKTNYFRFSLQGVANLHHIFDFQEWTKHIGLQVHGGAGYSTMGNDSISPFGKGRNMIHMIVGISPIFRINDRIAIRLDASAMKHMHRKYTMDMTQSRNTRGMDAFIGTMSVGLQINLGKQKTHADWLWKEESKAPKTPVVDPEVEKLKTRLQKLEEMHEDGDADGIPNYLDKELNTPAGKEVDAFGVAKKDTDADGIYDEVDNCPTVAGPRDNGGCPLKDTDGDGIIDDKDECPKIPGVAENNGCPKIEKEEQEIINTAFNDLEFESGKAVILKSSFKALDDLAALLKKKSEWGLRISGHTDNVGDDNKNLILSKDRANAVKKYLVGKGVSASRLESLYFGETKPVASNDTEEGRQKNRRVEMKITF